MLRSPLRRGQVIPMILPFPDRTNNALAHRIERLLLAAYNAAITWFAMYPCSASNSSQRCQTLFEVSLRMLTSIIARIDNNH